MVFCAAGFVALVVAGAIADSAVVAVAIVVSVDVVVAIVESVVVVGAPGGIGGSGLCVIAAA